MHRLEAFLRDLEVVPDDEVNHIVKRLSPKTNCQLLRIFIDSTEGKVCHSHCYDRTFKKRKVYIATEERMRW